MDEEPCPCAELTPEQIEYWVARFAAGDVEKIVTRTGGELVQSELLAFAGEGRIPKALGQYWTRGEGAAKIGWGTDGAFKRCTRLLRAKVKNLGIDIEGLCANLEKRATGHWPAEKVIDS